jgi:hypothetical protein
LSDNEKEFARIKFNIINVEIKLFRYDIISPLAMIKLKKNIMAL